MHWSQKTKWWSLGEPSSFSWDQSAKSFDLAPKAWIVAISWDWTVLLLYSSKWTNKSGQECVEKCITKCFSEDTVLNKNGFHTHSTPHHPNQQCPKLTLFNQDVFLNTLHEIARLPGRLTFWALHNMAFFFREGLPMVTYHTKSSQNPGIAKKGDLWIWHGAQRPAQSDDGPLKMIKWPFTLN